MSFQQMQQDAPVLKYPEDFAPHPSISVETAASMLLRAIQTSQNFPYHWTFIDKPQGTNDVGA
jgi:predicted secreted hydrolase